MKKSILIVLLSTACFINASAQRTYPTPTAEEIKEAQELAAKFYNRYNETQGIEPLIKEFFIKDFNVRVNYCFKTVTCGGHNRDFWQEFDDSFIRIKSKVTFQRAYKSSMNFIYLYARVLQYMSPDDGDITTDTPEEVTKAKVKKELISLFGNEPKQLKSAFDLFQINQIKKDGSSSFELPKFKTAAQFYKYVRKIERNVALLRIIETRWRTKRLTLEPKISFQFTVDDFFVRIADGDFFNYPETTRMVDVWWDNVPPHKYIPFKMDLIKENGKLKVVAIYPPMD
jgi:hypothetical protein